MDELAWSESQPVSKAQLKKWFGLDLGMALKEEGRGNLPEFLISIFLLVNIPAWLNMKRENMLFSIAISVIAIVLVYKLGKSRKKNE